jgi:hypothetical protein
MSKQVGDYYRTKIKDVEFGAAFGRPNKILVAFSDWATVHFSHSKSIITLTVFDVKR